ncbi:MAG: hypothetical protein PHS86_11785, partial [Syntrophaceae bacterium]|nr:hypothetical protein [Syntrophaceae bacterium]
EYRGQSGTNGCFGKTDVAEASGGGDVLGTYAPYNFYTGGYYIGRTTTAADFVGAGLTALAGPAPFGGRPYVQGQLVSSSDASWNTMFMLTNMQVRMNPAVRVRGSYYIGGWESPNNSNSPGSLVAYEYLNMEAHGVQRFFSPGYWRTLWLTAQLPWGEIAVGKRPASWGMGLAYDGADNRASEAFALVVPYGPIRIIMSMYPSRDYLMTDNYGTDAGVYNWQIDKNNKRYFDLRIPNITYAHGPISAGIYTNWVFSHRGGEARIENPATRVQTASRDVSNWYGGVFFKYNNGRFFLNSEVHTNQVTERRSGNQANNGTWSIPPIYTEHYQGAVEAGVLAGPAKIQAIAAWFTGDDYRSGQTIRGQRQFRYKAGQQPHQWSNTSVFRPYSYLAVYSYGLGNAFARDTGNGYVSDASVYAARLDYAVAANLNLFGSFMWAERFSKSGYTWGAIRPATVQSDGATAAAEGQVVILNLTRNGANPVPTVPDTALGWEIDAGFDWKLLEALTARFTFGYWQPGKWFNYAMVDKSINGWSTPLAAGAYQGINTFGTKPDKTIDAIMGVEFKLEGTF